jgi:hypothetical protein
LRIFGPCREEVTGGWRKLHREVLHNLYTALNTIRTMKSRKIRCTGHAACMDEIKMHAKF